MPNIQNIFNHYLICALWSSVDDNGDPLEDNYSVFDIHPSIESNLFEELQDFLSLLERENIDWTTDWTEEQFGHDFWLTRNGHGAGFWDRGHDNGGVLTQWAKIYGSCDLYVGDDGSLWV